jgi:hypothetical protein
MFAQVGLQRAGVDRGPRRGMQGYARKLNLLSFY